MALFLSTVLVLALGGLVAVGELVARYRDKPTSALLLPSSLFYVAVNAAASGAALGLIHGFGWQFGQKGAAAAITQVLVAGFGSLAFFRSSLFTVRVGSTDVGVGPSAVLDSILAAADRATDRNLGEQRSAQVAGILQGEPAIGSTEGHRPAAALLPGADAEPLTDRPGRPGHRHRQAGWPEHPANRDAGHPRPGAHQ